MYRAKIFVQTRRERRNIIRVTREPGVAGTQGQTRRHIMSSIRTCARHRLQSTPSGSHSAYPCVHAKRREKKEEQREKHSESRPRGRLKARVFSRGNEFSVTSFNSLILLQPRDDVEIARSKFSGINVLLRSTSRRSSTVPFAGDGGSGQSWDKHPLKITR